MAAQQCAFNQEEWNRQQFRAAFQVLATMALWIGLLVIPLYLSDSVACALMSIGPAVYMNAFLYKSPDALRTKNGSLFTAVCFVASLWLNAAVMTAAMLLRIL